MPENVNERERWLLIVRRLQDANIALTDVYFATDEYLEQLQPLQTGIITLINDAQEKLWEHTGEEGRA